MRRGVPRKPLLASAVALLAVLAIRAKPHAGFAGFAASPRAQAQIVGLQRLAGGSTQAASDRRARTPRSARDGATKAKEEEHTPWWKIEAEMERLLGPRMPFRVDRVSPPPAEQLGYEYLDSRTSKGDVITVRGSDTPVVVSRVRLLYDFVGGRYRIRTKILEVATPRRYAMNEKLQQMVTKDADTSAA